MFLTCVATTRKFLVKHKQQDLYFLKKRPDSNQPSKKRQTKQLRNFSCEKTILTRLSLNDGGRVMPTEKLTGRKL